MEDNSFAQREFNSVRKMREKGKTWQEIADSYGLSLTYVYKCFYSFFPKKHTDYSDVLYDGEKVRAATRHGYNKNKKSSIPRTSGGDPTK